MKRFSELSIPCGADGLLLFENVDDYLLGERHTVE